MTWLQQYPVPEVPDDIEERQSMMRRATEQLAVERASGGELISLAQSISRKTSDRYIAALQKALGKP